MSIGISAVVCTYNRSSYLCLALESLVHQSLPPQDYEIVVVDNGSTDDTQELVRREMAHVPILRYLHEPVLGLSQARNTGWQNARGEFVAFLDDDAVADPFWLERILRAFDMVPRPGCVGGKIRPIWVAPRPPWLSDQIMTYLAILDWSEIPVVSGERNLLAGANMAFPRSLLEAVGGFPQDVGRRGNAPQSNIEGDEVYVIRRLLKLGHACYYDPEITVSHHILPAKLTRDWFVGRMYGEGLGEAFLRIELERPTALLCFKIVLFSVLGLAVNSVRLALSFDQQKRFALRLIMLLQVGRIVGMWRYRKPLDSSDINSRSENAHSSLA